MKTMTTKRLTLKTDGSFKDVVCYELGSNEKPWIGSVESLGADIDSLYRLANDKIISLHVKGKVAQISGNDRVGLILLPSGRRLVIRSKINNLVLLDWLSFLGEFPPLENWLADAGVTVGIDCHSCIARFFLAEMESVTRLHVRKDYTPVISHGSTIRGRIITSLLCRRLNRLPNIPQKHRLRTLDTPYNIVLALALDKLPLLLQASSPQDSAQLARMRDLWAHVRRDLADPISAVIETQWACPPGYRTALQLARLILIGASLNPESGTGGQAFTLSLAAIWERGLRLIMDQLSPTTGWESVPDSTRTRRWDDYAEPQDSARWLTSDVMVRRDNRLWVLDAKYKQAFGIESRADRFQMCAYAVAFDADRVSLVYPASKSHADPRTLLKTKVAGKVITIDSINLPMSTGPEACKAALSKLSLLSQVTIDPSIE